jgi:ketosteroid isomerase-like protein
MKRWMLALLAALTVSWGVQAQTVEPDHEVHEQLRGILRGVEAAIANGQYDGMLPFLDERIAATSITQDVLSSRADVSNYFKTWFGPAGYMKSMTMKLNADALTELSPDKTWGLVRGDAIEHYEAKDGFQFDFKTRWTAVVTKGADDRWRIRAIHFGTNHLDNPVLTRVRTELTRYAYLGAAVALAIGLALGAWIGRRTARPSRA